MQLIASGVFLEGTGAVDGRPALLVFETRDEGTPAYFILLDWRDDSVAGIRDFRFARYVIDGAELLTVT